MKGLLALLGLLALVGVACGTSAPPTPLPTPAPTATPTALPPATPTPLPISTPTPTPRLSRQEAQNALNNYLLKQISDLPIEERREFGRIIGGFVPAADYEGEGKWVLRGQGVKRERDGSLNWVGGRWMLEETSLTITPINSEAAMLLEYLDGWKRAFTTPTPAPTPACQGQRPDLLVALSIVKVTARTRSGSVEGSGFIVDSDKGYILTATHIVADAYSDTIMVTFRNGVSQRATWVAQHSAADITLLSTEATRFPALSFEGAYAPPPQQDVVAIGWAGDTYISSPGVIKETQEDNPGHVNIIATTQVKAGMSGGPLVSRCGEVIGILSEGSVGGPSSETVAIALSWEDVNNIMTFAKEMPTPTPTPAPVPLVCSGGKCIDVSAVSGTLGSFGIGADVSGRLTNTSNKALTVCPTAVVYGPRREIVGTGQTYIYLFGIKMRPGATLPITIHVYGTFYEGAYPGMEVSYFENVPGGFTCP